MRFVLNRPGWSFPAIRSRHCFHIRARNISLDTWLTVAERSTRYQREGHWDGLFDVWIWSEWFDRWRLAEECEPFRHQWWWDSAHCLLVRVVLIRGRGVEGSLLTRELTQAASRASSAFESCYGLVTAGTKENTRLGEQTRESFLKTRKRTCLRVFATCLHKDNTTY